LAKNTPAKRVLRNDGFGGGDKKRAGVVDRITDRLDIASGVDKDLHPNLKPTGKVREERVRRGRWSGVQQTIGSRRF